jgi:hypothetical protein
LANAQATEDQIGAAAGGCGFGGSSDPRAMLQFVGSIARRPKTEGDTDGPGQGRILRVTGDVKQTRRPRLVRPGEPVSDTIAARCAVSSGTRRMVCLGMALGGQLNDRYQSGARQYHPCRLIGASVDKG